MGLGRLTPLQQAVLAVAAAQTDGWTLTGGGALVGFHLAHRTTRDVDLFRYGVDVLGREVDRLSGALRAASLQVTTVERAPAFVRLQVTSESETLPLDLVAEPVPRIEPPEERVLPSGATLTLDSMHEILVNKLNALLSRTELRDLVDVRALLGAGCDLARARDDAGRKDGGFSALTLAWVLGSFPVAVLAERSGMSTDESAGLAGFRDELVNTLSA